MQTRSSDENSVCLSVRLFVCLSVKRVDCDKTEEKSMERELDIVHVLQNTIDSSINSVRDRRGYVLEWNACLPNSVK